MILKQICIILLTLNLSNQIGDNYGKAINIYNNIYPEIKMLAQLTQAEAGNQDLTGMRYVVDVVLNRVDSEEFPDTIEDVIYQENQFSVIKDGAFEKAGNNISNDAIKAAMMEYDERLNSDILYFSRWKSKYADNHFKHQDHWFGW